MTVIIPVNETLDKIIGKQASKQNTNYRLSTYCVTVPCNEGRLLYHTLTGALMLQKNHEQNDPTQDELINNWFYVPEDFEEKQFADEVLRIAAILRSPVKHKNTFTILTTTDCNARCFYCYEMGIKRIPMTAEIAEDVADYICHASNGKEVKLSWFGGEPLFNSKSIEIICESLAQKSVRFESGMVTNGFYLDEDTVKHACDAWNLKKVQITIDGTETMYNKTKAYTDTDPNPYTRVMRNIRSALDAGIKVTIRCNMDAGNAEDLIHLTEDLSNRFPDQLNLKVYIALLQEFSGKIHEYRTLKQAEHDYLAVRNKLKEYGLYRVKELPNALRASRCMADNDASETILPDGRVGRCEHFSESMITGTIWGRDRDKAVEEMWKIPLLVPECRECVVYPICHKLKMCTWNRHGCNELDRWIKLEELRDQILTAYRNLETKEK